MKHVDLSSFIAAEMDKALNSEENKKLFSTASMIEKQAFHRVADEDKLTSEVEQELLTKKASCKCSEESDHDKESCECDCHEKTSTAFSVSDAFKSLLKVSEALDDAGFNVLAADSIVLANRLVIQAKAKKDKKSETKSDKKSDPKSSKDSKKPKMTMKERMDKMRKMKGKGKDSKKAAPKSKPESKSTKK